MKITLEIEKAERDGSPEMCACGVPFGSGWQRMLSEKAIPEDSQWVACREKCCLQKRERHRPQQDMFSSCKWATPILLFTEGFSDSLVNQVASCSWTGMTVRIWDASLRATFLRDGALAGEVETLVPLFHFCLLTGYVPLRKISSALWPQFLPEIRMLDWMILNYLPAQTISEPSEEQKLELHFPALEYPAHIDSLTRMFKANPWGKTSIWTGVTPDQLLLRSKGNISRHLTFFSLLDLIGYDFSQLGGAPTTGNE